MTAPSSSSLTDLKCHLCGSSGLQQVSQYQRMARVTSDCKPWRSGGLLAVCEDCHLVQTVTTLDWHKEAAEIYAQYTIYHQSGGVEQSVFAKDNGQGRRRSEVILAALVKEELLPQQGHLLDLGCGNGAFLRAAGAALAGWKLFGSEWDDKYLASVHAIPGFEKLHTGDWSSIPGSYDVISMIHVLEHISSPLSVLELIRSKLADKGLLVVQVPDCQLNPYMLLIADHCSHFSVNTLCGLMVAAGFEVLIATNTWVQKEVTVVARAAKPAVSSSVVLPSEDSESVIDGMKYLEQVLRKAQQTADSSLEFGVFGTSIAATWLVAHLRDRVSFFVDEDISRTGGTHMGRPILLPAEVREGAVVFVALPQPLADQVAMRNEEYGVCYVVP